MHYLLFYEFVPDYLEQRPQFRSTHLTLAWEAQARGELVLAGAYADPTDGAALLFSCDSEQVPQSFAEADPTSATASSYAGRSVPGPRSSATRRPRPYAPDRQPTSQESGTAGQT